MAELLENALVLATKKEAKIEDGRKWNIEDTLNYLKTNNIDNQTISRVLKDGTRMCRGACKTAGIKLEELNERGNQIRY